jgi:hypothetical protein
VQAALTTFAQDFLGTATEKITTTDQADANTKQALKFLRDFKSMTHHTQVKEACAALLTLIEYGTYTPLALELKKLNQKFFKKRELTASQVDNLLIALAKKYNIQSNEEETAFEEIDANIAPEIVLSETFVE